MKKYQYRPASDHTDTSSFCILNSAFSLRRSPSGVTFHGLMEKEPSHVLCATSARIGGIGLDSVAHYRNPDLVLKMGAAGRERAVGQFTWDHFRRRVLEAYRAAMAIRQPQLV
jgi:hypothetical protein